MRSAIVALYFLCVGPEAHADIYKCAMPSGRTEYRATPCDAGKPSALPIKESVLAAENPASAPGVAGALPEIVGSDRFQQRVRDALALLKARGPDAYAVATSYVGWIAQAARSGMRADAKPTTFFLTEDAATFSIEWAAAVIAHDSYHSKLYFDYRGSHTGPVPPQAWGGTQSEIKCMRYQLAVMRRIGSPT